MSLAHYLFGFSGRINRAKQWAIIFVSLLHYALLSFAFGYTIGWPALGELLDRTTTVAAIAATPQAKTFAIAFGVLYVLSVYIALAVVTKRLHDRNKSAWWLLVFFVLPLLLNVPTLQHFGESMQEMFASIHALQSHLPPPRPRVRSPLEILSSGGAAIVSFWVIVELYILRGTAGDNRFGPDPLAKTA